MSITTTRHGLTIHELLADARSILMRLDPRASLAATAAGGLIVDIRSDAQRAEQGALPGARVVARNVLEWRFDARTDYCDPAMIAVEGPLILMCAEGYQSSLAAANLQRIGVVGATDMIGGFEAWRAQGLPVLPC